MIILNNWFEIGLYNIYTILVYNLGVKLYDRCVHWYREYQFRQSLIVTVNGIVQELGRDYKVRGQSVKLVRKPRKRDKVSVCYMRKLK